MYQAIRQWLGACIVLEMLSLMKYEKCHLTNTAAFDNMVDRIGGVWCH